MVNKKSIVQAHDHSDRHRNELEQSEICGCFYCLRIFKPSLIEDWIEEESRHIDTALCPYCNIDSVIGSKSGYPITKSFLKQMKSYWF